MEVHSLARPTGGFTAPRSRKLLAAFGDERLVEQLRRGNDVAFEVLYDRHHRGVLSYCRHMLGSLDEAEDALQQAFASAHADIVASDKPISFKAWIYTIARNRCLSMLRARREQPSDEVDAISTAGLAEEVQQRAELKEIVGDLHELPEDQRAALVLSQLGDLSHGEVAKVIGCEEPKVKSLVYQARSGLIERRQARETPCQEIREQLATLRGGSLRRGPLRRHIKDCPGCAEFRADVKRQRQLLAVALPVVPTLGLRESALAAAGLGGGSAAGGSALTAGGIGAATVAKTGAAKVAVIAIAAGGAAVGGGAAVEQTVLGDQGQKPAAVQPENSAAGALGTADRRRGAEPGPREASGNARGGDGRRRSQEAHVQDGARGDRSRGFRPERGRSNGDRARDFAATRGKEGQSNLKTPPGQARAKEPPATGRGNAGTGGRPETTPGGRPDKAPGAQPEPAPQAPPIVAVPETAPRQAPGPQANPQQLPVAPPKPKPLPAPAG